MPPYRRLSSTRDGCARRLIYFCLFEVVLLAEIHDGVVPGSTSQLSRTAKRVRSPCPRCCQRPDGKPNPNGIR